MLIFIVHLKFSFYTEVNDGEIVWKANSSAHKLLVDMRVSVLGQVF